MKKNATKSFFLNAAIFYFFPKEFKNAKNERKIGTAIFVIIPSTHKKLIGKKTLVQHIKI